MTHPSYRVKRFGGCASLGDSATFAARLHSCDRRSTITPMSDAAPTIKVPHGYSVVSVEGGFEIVPNGETMSRTVAFRLPASLYADLLELNDTFPERSWAASMRWLVSDPEVRMLIRKRIDTRTQKADRA